MVFIAHSHDLSQIDSLKILSDTFSSTLAVQAFFVISGYLIFQSYEKSSSIKSYAEKRIKRIYPAYFVSVVGFALILGLIGELSFYEYISSQATWRYLFHNLTFLNFLAPELPGVFQENHIRAINGALWTLKVEAAFYIAVPICVWLFRKAGRTPTLVSIYLLSALYGAAMLYIAQSRHSGAFVELSRQLPGQMTYFVAGAAIYYSFDYFKGRALQAFVAGLFLFFLSAYAFELLLRPMGVALLVMSAAFGPYLGRFGRYGDFSYGIYIVHFPILQILISLGLAQLGALPFLLIAIPIVLTSAVLMWHLVEKRFLRRDSHYRREADGLPQNPDSADVVREGASLPG
jgi:peptidoglycan/LPS O-acetylase OafA/YrhL